ncbi:hypothetical protein D3C72_2579340 [compost metagenome]
MDGEPNVFHLDGNSPAALAIAEGFELEPKDVVYVNAREVVRWSRVINQLLPSTQPVFSSATAFK